MPNLLLKRFPADVQAQLGPHLQRIELRAGTELHASHAAAQHVYLPATAVLALRHEGEPGHSVVVALIGSSGLAGASALLGADATRCDVLVAGEAWRLEAGHLRAAFERHAAMRQLLLGWLQVLMTQAVQAASCQRLHSPQQRLCLRVAQLAQERGCDDIELTQEQLGTLAGVRRERANELLGRLLGDGLIAQQRGCIRVLDADAVALRACGCLGAVADALSRAMRRGQP